MKLKPLAGILEIFYAEIVASILALGLVLASDHRGAVSFMAGAAAMLLANGYLTWRVYRQQKAMRPMHLVLSFFSGEFGKYIVLALCTFLFAKALALNWIFYILGIGVPQLGGVVVYGMRKAWRT